MVHQSPGSFLCLFPTEKVARKWVRTRLDPMLNTSPALRALVPEQITVVDYAVSGAGFMPRAGHSSRATGDRPADSRRPAMARRGRQAGSAMTTGARHGVVGRRLRIISGIICCQFRGCGVMLKAPQSRAALRVLPMPFIPRDDAERITAPYFDDFVAIVAQAWADWRTGGLAAQMQHRRVRANYVWNQLLVHARRRFEGQNGIRVETLKAWDGVLIGEQIFVRMKKGTSRLLSRNYPTQASLAFHDQVQDLFGGIARLELLYVLDDDETDIERIALIQRHKQNVAWAIDLLNRNRDDDSQNVMPFAPSPPSGSPAERIIKPREETADNEKRQRGGES